MLYVSESAELNLLDNVNDTDLSFVVHSNKNYSFVLTLKIFQLVFREGPY